MACSQRCRVTQSGTPGGFISDLTRIVVTGGMIFAGQLRLSLDYGSGQYDEATARAFALGLRPAFDAIDRLYVGPALTRLDEKNV